MKRLIALALGLGLTAAAYAHTPLKASSPAADAVLAAPHAAVERELADGTLRALPVADLPPLSSSMGIVTLRGRTPSPMADLIIRRLPSADSSAARRAASRRGTPTP